MASRLPRTHGSDALEAPGPDPETEDVNIAPRGAPQPNFAIVKPKVLVLLVLAGATGFVAASERSYASVEQFVWMLVGGFLATGSANIFNNIMDRDRDSLMARTMWRPLPAGTIGTTSATALAMVMAVAGLAILFHFLNPLAALLTVAGMAYYIVVYTFGLKPRTYENITIGGVAGAFPPVVGWVAVTGELDWPPVVLGMMIVLWTPPHFWSLALFHKEDYKRAGFPMLPVVKGERVTQLRIVAYSITLLVASLANAAVDARMDWLYLYGIIALNVPLLYLSAALLHRGSMKDARRLFMYSNIYLALAFALIMLDARYVYFIE
jgi:protoheme IX farnesyltransferase